MILKTILIFLIGLLGYSEWLLGTSCLQRPIVLGPLVGLVMGNLPAGIIMGATMELALVGAVSIGAYNPPDLIAGTVLGVSLAIQSGAGAETALVLGIPIATVMLAANTGICQPLMLVMIHKCDRDAEKGNIRAFNRDYLIAGYLQNLFGIVCIPLAFYFGSDAVTALLGKIPEFVQSGMDITAALLPWFCNACTADDESQGCTIFLPWLFPGIIPWNIHNRSCDFCRTYCDNRSNIRHIRRQATGGSTGS